MVDFDFGEAFRARLDEHDLLYAVKGFVMADGSVYPLGTDTKVLSTVFEAVARPHVSAVAQTHGRTVKEARAQNYYPDFTILKNEGDREKIAVDVKTTYRDADDAKVSFTLGSYTSFIRPGRETKNIEYPYSEYAEHWIVGFIYKQAQNELPALVRGLDELDCIPSPFENVDVFVREKWQIAGDSAGSGNTTNIGSIRGRLADFDSGDPLFRTKEEFLDYWRGYGRTAADRVDTYKNVAEYRLRLENE